MRQSRLLAGFLCGRARPARSQRLGIARCGVHRLWFDYGNAVGDIDSYYVEYAVHVDSIFNNKGYDSKNFKNILFNGEKHSGKSWNKRLDQIFEFLLKE